MLFDTNSPLWIIYNFLVQGVRQFSSFWDLLWQSMSLTDILTFRPIFESFPMLTPYWHHIGPIPMPWFRFSYANLWNAVPMFRLADVFLRNFLPSWLAEMRLSLGMVFTVGGLTGLLSLRMVKNFIPFT